MPDPNRGNPWENFRTAGEPDSRRDGPFVNLLLFLFWGVIGAGAGYVATLMLIFWTARSVYIANHGAEMISSLMIDAPPIGAGVGAILAIGFVARSLRAKARANRRD